MNGDIRCPTCGATKQADDFAFRDIRRGKRQWQCRVCHAAARRGHYLATKAVYIKRETARNARKTAANRARLLGYLLAHPCVDCGERDPVVLDFDHRTRKEKIREVTQLAGRSWRTVEAELRKCDIRCANCHRRRTAEQFGWAKVQLRQRRRIEGTRE